MQTKMIKLSALLALSLSTTIQTTDNSLAIAALVDSETVDATSSYIVKNIEANIVSAEEIITKDATTLESNLQDNSTTITDATVLQGTAKVKPVVSQDTKVVIEIKDDAIKATETNDVNTAVDTDETATEAITDNATDLAIKAKKIKTDLNEKTESVEVFDCTIQA